MKKRIIVAKLVNETAKLMFIVCAFYWIGAGLMVGDWFIVKEYMYPPWLTVPAMIGIAYIEYLLMQFICLLENRIEQAERRERKQQRNLQKAAEIQKREESYRQWVENCERFYMANTEYLEALEALKIAHDHFNNAEEDYIEAAIYEITAAEKRVQAAMKKERLDHVGMLGLIGANGSGTSIYEGGRNDSERADRNNGRTGKNNSDLRRGRTLQRLCWVHGISRSATIKARDRVQAGNGNI